MTSQVFAGEATDRVAAIMALIVSRHVRHLPEMAYRQAGRHGEGQRRAPASVAQVLADANVLHKYIGGNV